MYAARRSRSQVVVLLLLLVLDPTISDCENEDDDADENSRSPRLRRAEDSPPYQAMRPIFMTSRRAWPVISFLLLPASPALASNTNDLLNAWLNSQTNIQTWSAQVIQTRNLKSLVQPIIATGQVWFAAPNRFRWELGNPPQTIAVRQPDRMLVIYPRLKRIETYPLTAERGGRWRDTLALLEAGFARSQSDLESRFRIVSETGTNELHEVTLVPRSPSARRMMPQIRIGFSTNDYSLRLTELQFADGSTMRNDFTNATLNPRLDDSLFAPQIAADFKVIEPLKEN